MADVVEAPVGLGAGASRGLAWSLLNNVVSRAGSFLTGIVVVRLLTETQYGVYGVGLVVLTVLLSMNELGVSVAVIQRPGDIRAIAPTVTTLAIASSTCLAAIGFVAAPWIARAMGSTSATGVIRLLLVNVVLDGVASVPNALMTRLFQQRKRLYIDTAGFVVATPVTIVLAATGHGAWSLAWGALAGNLTTAVLALWFTPIRIWPGWRKDLARELLHFGMPLAGASLLLLAMMNVDYVVVGHTLGLAQLGLYLLAFNLCSWPITILTSAFRRVALALFSRLAEGVDGGREAFGRVLGLVVTVTLPMCVGIGVPATALIAFLYGERWTPAAAALTMLAVFSVVRVLVEVTYDFLAAVGRTGSTVWLHGLWLVAAVPALILGTRWDGIRGTGIAHAVVAVGVVVPVLIHLLRGAGVSMRSVASQLVRPLLGAAAMTAVILAVTTAGARTGAPAFLQLVVSAVVGLAVYGACVWPSRHDLRSLLHLGDPVTS